MTYLIVGDPVVGGNISTTGAGTSAGGGKVGHCAVATLIFWLPARGQQASAQFTSGPLPSYLQMLLIFLPGSYAPGGQYAFYAYAISQAGGTSRASAPYAFTGPAMYALLR